MTILSNSVKWLFSYTPLNLYDNNNKNILIFTNVFLILVSLYILKKKRNNKNLFTIFLLVCMCIISCIFHYKQCHHHSYDNIKKWGNIDVILALFLTFIVIYFYCKSINLKIVILGMIGLFLFCLTPSNTSTNIYIYSHSMWHIIVGLIIFLLIINDKDLN